jgi:Phage integrase, N-terminal SAM-like domain
MKLSLSIAGKASSAFSKESVLMSDLRERMIGDMRSQGLSASTQEVYLQGVKGLAAYYRRPPDQLDEKEVRGYLLYLRDERGVARGTYMPHQSGIRFLFAHTLDRDWPLFLKKESALRRPSGRDAIANSGAARHAYLHAAIDRALRALRGLNGA